MGKNRNLVENSSQNFILRGLNSIQIGLYILLSAFLIKSFLEGFLSDVSPLGMMSIQIIEGIGLFLVIFLVLLSALAIFFSNRRQARRNNFKVWNKASKRNLGLYLLLSFLGIMILYVLNSNGVTSFLAPAYLIYFAIILFFLNIKKKKPYYLLSIISFVLGILVFFIPSYWYSAILITGASFLVYGISVRK